MMKFSPNLQFFFLDVFPNKVVFDNKCILLIFQQKNCQSNFLCCNKNTKQWKYVVKMETLECNYLEYLLLNSMHIIFQLNIFH